jgi:hypothetical protein
MRGIRMTGTRVDEYKKKAKHPPPIEGSRDGSRVASDAEWDRIAKLTGKAKCSEVQA